MKITIEFDREEDGRWIADVQEHPGAMAYGDTWRDAAIRALMIPENFPNKKKGRK